MCWNASISFNTYIFSLFASIFAYINNTLQFNSFMFIQSFATMQLVEYFIWSKTFSNSSLSKAGLALIISQPFFSIIRLNNSQYLLPLLFGYLIYCVILLLFLHPIQNIDFRSIPYNNGHLSWKWLFSKEITIPWMIFLLFPFYLKHEYLTLCFALISYIITFILFYKAKTVGSMWCWFINITSIFFIANVFWKDLRKIPNYFSSYLV